MDYKIFVLKTSLPCSFGSSTLNVLPSRTSVGRRWASTFVAQCPRRMTKVVPCSILDILEPDGALSPEMTHSAMCS